MKTTNDFNIALIDYKEWFKNEYQDLNLDVYSIEGKVTSRSMIGTYFTANIERDIIYDRYFEIEFDTCQIPYITSKMLIKLFEMFKVDMHPDKVFFSASSQSNWEDPPDSYFNVYIAIDVV